MATQNFIKTHQFVAAPVASGNWKLAARSAITLQPRQDGVLRIAQGRVWATFDGPHSGPLNDQGDAVIGAGSELTLRAGQRLVIENWNADGAPACFSWDRAPQRPTVPQVGRQTGRGLDQAMRTKRIARTSRISRISQPLADLQLALVFGAGALDRLVIALVGSMRDRAAIIAGWPAPSRCNTRSAATKSWT